MKFPSLLLIVSLFSAGAFADNNNIKIQLHFSPLANLVYQLDCISGALPHCSHKTYQDLWDKNFIKNEEDKEKIKSWGELTDRYHTNIDFKESSPNRFEGTNLFTKLRIASFQSMTMNEYFNRLDLIVTPKDKEKFENVIHRFYPPFDKWWKSTALPKGKKFTRETDKLLTSPKITTKIRHFAHFYAAVLPDKYIIHFNLFYRPDFAEATKGQQIENYSVAEFLPDEKPVDRIDVIIHELCHFFYENATDENIASLQPNFDKQEKEEGRGAYNLLNETLATALGNGLINKLTMKKTRWEKYLAKEQSFYNEYNIDKAAKTILPWIETWVDQGKTLYDPQFIPQYLSSLKKAFGKELSTPRLLLNELALIADNKYNEEFKDKVRQSLRASSLYFNEGSWSDDQLLKTYRQRTNLSALFIVHPSNLNQLKEKGILSKSDLEQLEKQYKKNDQVLFSFKRTPSAIGYVIAASNYEKVLDLIEKLGSLKQGFDGAYSGP